MLDYQKIHRDAFVADMHCDTVHKIKRGYSLKVENNKNHIDIPRLKKGGVNLQAFALFVDNRPDSKNFDYVYYLLQVLLKEIERNSDDVSICRTAEDIKNINTQDKIAALIAIENGSAIENSLEKLEHFYDKGIRYLTLTHMDSHDWCSSSSDAGGEKYGLTTFGKEVIDKMNMLHMMIDVSHISVKAFYDVLEKSTSPVIASHSNAYSLCAHDRNLNDDQLKALAQNNGVVGINFFPMFLDEDYKQAAETVLSKNMSTFIKSMQTSMEKISEEEHQRKQKEFDPLVKEYFKAVEPFPVLVDHIVNHIDYIVNLIGIDYVAFGSDFDGIIAPPTGMEDVSYLPAITEKLVSLGYTEEDIQKVLGLNFLRVFQTICG